MSNIFLTRPTSLYRDSFLDGLREFHAEGLLTDWDSAVIAGDFDSFVQMLLDRERGREDILVPETHLWVIAEGQYAGRVGIRHYLNNRLREWGGHIGYQIRPSMRGRGIGTRACALGLLEARALGIKRALLTCNDDNLASARIIENNGGVLENVARLDNGTLYRRYWIDLRTDAERQPRVGTGTLILQGAPGFEQALLTLRRRSPEGGKWSILGGKVEFMETLETAAIREAREEAGLEVKLVELLVVTDHLLPEEGEHWIAPAYLAQVIGGNLENREPEKAAALRWFPLNALPPNLTMTARAAIDAYQRRYEPSWGVAAD